MKDLKIKILNRIIECTEARDECTLKQLKREYNAKINAYKAVLKWIEEEEKKENEEIL